MLARSRERAREINGLSREEIIQIYSTFKRSKTNKKLNNRTFRRERGVVLSAVTLVMHACAC